jgi:hypothetical protein
MALAPAGPGGLPKPAVPGAPPGGSAAGPGTGGPTPSPMATPQPNPGIEKAARAQVQTASTVLQQQLPKFPLDSEEFKAIDSALKVLTKAFGKNKDEDRKLMPAEIMNMLGAVGAKPGAPPPGAGAGGPPPGAGGPPPGPPPAA